MFFFFSSFFYFASVFLIFCVPENKSLTSVWSWSYVVCFFMLFPFNCIKIKLKFIQISFGSLAWRRKVLLFVFFCSVISWVFQAIKFGSIFFYFYFLFFCAVLLKKQYLNLDVFFWQKNLFNVSILHEHIDKCMFFFVHTFDVCRTFFCVHFVNQ